MPGEVSFDKTAPGHLMREEVLRLGYALLSTNRWLDGERAQGVYIMSLKVRMPTEDHPECLVIVSAFKEGLRLVGFNTSDSPAEAIKGAIQRIENGTMVWREDNYSRPAVDRPG